MNFFDDFNWHSSLEINDSILRKKKIKKLSASKKNKDKFIRIASDSSFLIHKSTKKLWKISDDGGSIEPVFPDDVITEETL